ncbi:Polynucleotide adenylyltransferase family protein [Euphorbia peplus]|nr:Polynucleotide adenylyltransferase family protein [Euphorbia peplus]
MAITGLSGFAYRSHLSIRPPLYRCIRKPLFAALPSLDEPDLVVNNKGDNSGVREGNNPKGPVWKKLNSKDLGISTSKLTLPTRKVLNRLKQQGYEVYLVGGCVRDLILKQTPKDFDIITSAELKEVVRAFSRCEIVGRRFPICHVHVGDTTIEVSSFSTTVRKFGADFRNNVQCPFECSDKDYVRWRNCLSRDFTINGLMFDPYAKIVYDYMGGLQDIQKAKVRTIMPASASFQEDCARILRAIRVAARLGFHFSKETAHFAKNLAILILRLDKGRLMTEVNYMLAYGSAEASLRLLWKFGLLEILLPFQAAYFVRHGFKRRDKRSNMLLSLFRNMDKFLAPDRPCHSNLWIGMLAFHKALADKPRDPLVVAVFSLAVHNGGDMSAAVSIARKISTPHDASFQELAEARDLDANELIDEVMELAVYTKQVMSMMTDEQCVSQAMAEYPQAPHTDLVFISLAMYLRACRIFECVGKGRERGFIPKQGSKINYELLGSGSMQEVRHTFARIVFDTVYPLNLS